MNFKTFLESAQDEIYDITITIKPIEISENKPAKFDNQEYVSLRGLKRAITEAINFSLANPWELNFEMYIDHKQQYANNLNTPTIIFSVSGYKSKDKENRQTIEHKIKYLLANKSIKDSTVQNKWYPLDLLQDLKIESETDKFKKGLKSQTQKTFGGFIDEL